MCACNLFGEYVQCCCACLCNLWCVCSFILFVQFSFTCAFDLRVRAILLGVCCLILLLCVCVCAIRLVCRVCVMCLGYCVPV